MNYSQLAFTEGIKAIQQRMGSRNAYDRVEKMSFVDGLTAIEANFIGQMDSFYMASSGENDFPYIQHRGGPKGFIKIIDSHTLGLWISVATGNIYQSEISLKTQRCR